MSSQEDISVRELLATVKDYVNLAWTKKPALLAVGLVCASIFGVIAIFKKPVYIAELEFLLNEDPSPGFSIGALLGQVGLGGGGAEYNLEKILALSKSPSIAQQVLLDSIVIDEQVDLVANHILELEGMREKWSLVNDAKISGNSLGEMDSLSRIIYRWIYNYSFIKPGLIFKTSAAENSGIMTVSSISVNEELALKSSTLLYRNLSEFYTGESIGNRQKSVNLLRNKADSLRRILENKEYRAAEVQDTKLGLIQARDNVERTRLQREVGMLSLGYGEVVRNLETASFALSSSTPFFQVIGEPFKPLPQNRSNLYIQSAIGFVLGLIVSYSYFAAIKFYRDSI